MRLGKAWIVAAKEMREFKGNKYILFSLLLPPLLLSVVLPLGTFGPIAALGPSDTPLPLDPVITVTRTDEVIVGETLVNVSIRDSVVRDAVIRGSLVVNSTLVRVNVQASVLERVVVKESLIIGSNLVNSTDVQSTSIRDSAVLGDRGEDFTRTILGILNAFLLFFVIIPAAIPAVIASYSFVGEKVGKSLEPLLATPTTDEELLLGKALAIFLPTLGVTWGSALLFMGITNVVVAEILGFAPLPTLQWVLGVLLLVPLFGTLSIMVNVIISSRVSDVRASQQLGTLVVVPAIFLFIGVMFGAIVFDIGALVFFALVVLLLDLAMIYVALRVFNREDILVSWK
ncbi:MAG: ABC transporter permease subunit [Thermoplasmata archaeon]